MKSLFSLVSLLIVFGLIFWWFGKQTEVTTQTFGEYGQVESPAGTNGAAGGRGGIRAPIDAAEGARDILEKGPLGTQ